MHACFFFFFALFKHCFKDIKKDAVSKNNNISTVCKKCSKTLKERLTSTTNFLNHIKVSNLLILFPNKTSYFFFLLQLYRQ